MRPPLRFAAILLGLAQILFADAGVLVPAGHDQPDPAVFSLNEMTVAIKIDNGIACVQVRQIFGNHQAEIQEGSYTFALPASAGVSDFAVWDDVVRIPGVILERKRAQEIYSRVRARQLDPGLLQMGERDADEAGRNSLFSARIVPFAPFANKRIELEYQERLAVENLQSLLAIPLRPDVYREQTAGHLTVTLELHSAHAIDDFTVVSRAYPLKVTERTPNTIRAEYFASNVLLSEDLAIRYRYAAADTNAANAVKVITQSEGGENFFQATALLAPNPARSGSAAPPRTVVALFDTSLSMQWEKLERSYQSLETLLKRLRPQDHFSLLLFNSEVSPFRPAPVPASIANVEAALAFTRASDIRSGTDMRRALTDGLTQAARGGGERYLVLIGDGGATEGTVQNGKLSAWYATERSKLAEASRPHTFVFAVGDDANLPLARLLAANNGVWESVRSTEPVEFKLNAFLSKIGEEPVRGLDLTATPAANFRYVYPLEAVRFAGSAATWIGQYTNAAPGATFSVGAPGTATRCSYRYRRFCD